MKHTAIFACVILATGLYARAGAGNDCTNPIAAWARTRGVQRVTNRDIAVDAAGSVLIVGDFLWPTDFDPTECVDEHMSNGDKDVFVAKLGPDGSYAWTRTIGGTDADFGKGVTVDTDGSVLVVGAFHDTVDFDPTVGVDEHTALDNPGTAGTDFNSFITLLDADGGYLWTNTFGGGDGSSGAARVKIDGLGDIVVVGSYDGTVDFDPGTGIDEHSSVPISTDIYVTKLLSDGSYAWTRTMGGSGFDTGTDVDVDVYGDIVITGTFRGVADFDPSDGVDLHTATGIIRDIYVTKLYADGSYGWTRTWPVFFSGTAGQVAVDADGNVAITGGFNGTIDFDPTAGVDRHTSNAMHASIFVTKLYADGSYAWTASFLSTFQALGEDAAFDADGNVLAIGEFIGETDFDPSEGVDARIPVGDQDAFITKLTSEGTAIWTRTLGGEGTEAFGKELAIDAEGSFLVNGWYRETVDLDPGCGIDSHTSFMSSNDYFVLKLHCIEPTADVNGDGFADLRDYTTMQNCFSGPAPTACDSACYAFDLDSDDDIDGDDHAIFVDMMTWP